MRPEPSAADAPGTHRSQEPLLSSDELSALMQSESAEAAPPALDAGVAELFSLLGDASVAGPAGSKPAAADPPAAAPHTDAGAAAAAAPDRDAGDAGDSPLAAELAPPRVDRLGPAVVEVFGLFAVAVVIELNWSGQIGAFAVHPHPYWLIVLPIAASRGLWAGLAAAAIGALLYAVGAAAALQPADPLALLDHRVMLEPILFVFAAFLVGQLRDDLQLRYRKLWRVFQHQRDEALRLTRQNERLFERNRDYQSRLLDHSAQFGNLIDVARRLESAGAREIHELALDMVREHCGASRCSLLSVIEIADDDAPDQLEIIVERGWSQVEARARLEDAGRSPVLRRALRAGTAVDGFDPATPAPGYGPLLAAPLFDSHNHLTAVLCLDDLPADRFSANLAAMFFRIVEWVTLSLHRVAAGRRAEEFTLPTAATETASVWIDTPAALGERLRREDARCTLHGMAASLIALQATELAEVGADAERALDAALVAVIGTCLRASDSVFHLGYPGCWVLVLPDTPLAGARVVCQRIERRLQFVDSGALGPLAIGAWAPDDDHADLRAVLPALAGRCRESSSLPLDGRCPVEVPTRPTIGSAAQFVRQVQVELDLTSRNDQELYVAELRLAETSTTIRALFAQQLELVLESALRGIDGVYAVGDGRYSLLLPGADGLTAFGAVGGLLEALADRVPEAALASLHQEVYALHGLAEEAQQLLARLSAELGDGQPRDPRSAAPPEAVE